jgi:hypothetical protein
MSLFDDTWGGNPSTTIPQPLQTSQSMFNTDAWGGSPSTTIPPPLQTSQSTFNTDPWGFSDPAVSAKQPVPRREDVSFL